MTEPSLWGEIIGILIELVAIFFMPLFLTELLSHSKEKLKEFDEDEDED